MTTRPCFLESVRPASASTAVYGRTSSPSSPLFSYLELSRIVPRPPRAQGMTVAARFTRFDPTRPGAEDGGSPAPIPLQTAGLTSRTALLHVREGVPQVDPLDDETRKTLPCSSYQTTRSRLNG
jgi:hypothetical protein